ncbi:hypothetical protein HanPI659440_Chr13g0514421 [Helianthus annuus]|nr:hypothetical protein HanPI659440_Chr13g0514421 [Helianthus annuus]
MWFFVLNEAKMSFVCSLYVCLSMILFVWLELLSDIEVCTSCLSVFVLNHMIQFCGSCLV